VTRASTLSDLSVDAIRRAAGVIDPAFLNSPQFEDDQLNAALGHRVLVKVETVNPIRSFKGRGADFRISQLESGQQVVCASAGNFGQALAYSGRARGVGVTVFVPHDVNPVKRARIEGFGATVHVGGEDFEAAKRLAVAHAAKDATRTFIEDGDDSAISEGAGTIAIELERAGEIDAIVVPVGDGALISGIATWVKARSRGVRVIGVGPKGGAAMVESWKARRPVSVDATNTIADGLAVRVPVKRAVERLIALADDMLAVDDSEMIQAMRLAARTLGIVLEPSGAAGIAAIARHRIPGERIATILTGSNVHPDLFRELCGVQ